MFKYNCFIRKISQRILDVLYNLGYNVTSNTVSGAGIATMSSDALVLQLPITDDGTYGIDCGDNEDLFLAISAISDHTDYMQWFILDASETYPDKNGMMVFCTKEDFWGEHLTDFYGTWRKAEPDELIKYFGSKDR